jgi:diacylglycerol kinase (ATP)
MRNRNFAESFKNAINGIKYAIGNERNFKIHIIIALIALLLSIYYNIAWVELLMVCLAIALVVICELFNTVIEVLVDIIIEIYHPKAKIIKDVAAGAVLFSAFFALTVGYVVFFERIVEDIITRR